MPGMDGFTVAQQIQQNVQMSGSTILMLTSAANAGDIARCRGVTRILVTSPIVARLTITIPGKEFRRSFQANLDQLEIVLGTKWNRIGVWGMCKLIEKMVARDGIEPPTPAFSGLLTD